MSDTPRTDIREFTGFLNAGETVVSSDFARQLERENAELREHLTWLLSSPRCTCYDPDCRWQLDDCTCGYDKKMKAALKAVAKGEIYESRNTKETSRML